MFAHGHRPTKKLSLRKLKRRICRVPGRSVSIDERLAGLTEQLTVIEDADTRGSGEPHEQHLLNASGLMLSHCPLCLSKSKK